MKGGYYKIYEYIEIGPLVRPYADDEILILINAKVTICAHSALLRLFQFNSECTVKISLN